MQFVKVNEESGYLKGNGIFAGYSARPKRGIVWYVRIGNDEIARGCVATVAQAQELIIRNLSGARPRHKKIRPNKRKILPSTVYKHVDDKQPKKVKIHKKRLTGRKY